MSAAHINSEFSGFNRVSSSSASSSISSFNFSSASVSSSSSSLRESGVVPGESVSGCSLSANFVTLQKKDKSAIAAIAMSTQVTPKILSNINSKESIHKSNPVHHHEMVEEPKVNAASLPLSDDPRTLQLALELSLVGFNDNQTCFAQPAQALSLPLTAQNDFEMGTINGVPAFSKTDSTLPPPSASSCLLLPVAGTASLEDRSKKSQNMTECVPVPSSEHVAEIVGRQGCKIKALRAKTNTYIKTPVRGEEPVFVVTGRKEDVNKAKREILSAADHFSLIRASRKPISDGHSTGIVGIASCSGAGAVPRMQSGPPCMPGQVTIQVRVPYRVVGLVVGPKGATIKHIQQETQTYIVTPSREKEPIFEVTGLPDNVDTARKQIEAHIALRTGAGSGSGDASTMQGSDLIEANEFEVLPTINSLTQILNDDLNSEILSSIYKNAMPSAQDYANNSMKIVGNGSNSSKPMPGYHAGNCFQKTEFSDVEMMATLTPTRITDKHLPANEVSVPLAKANVVFRNTSNKTLTFCPPTSTSASASASIHSNSNANILTRSCSSASSTTSTKSTNNSANTPPEILNIWKNISDSIDVDEGIGDSPSIWNQPANIIPTAHCSPTISISPTDSLLGLAEHSGHQKNMHHTKEPTVCNTQQKPQSIQLQSNPDKFLIHRECFVCNENNVTTALVPCGHNMFCMECANQICISMEAVCPVCNSIVYHAMRILG
ncbi:RNA-binding protein MEX3A [Drosophila gunungcola]|uniref:RNA-binding protein MEX3A n=1 Tax=Drosophila gunungcola TaxID=103775 RepID=UPI0022E25244|nr:RNA-binding protein MEX3A [Drosophila gunungcola]XP_052854987.1 RNA-binding protein MEX3A [Drosophila gunungcola]XP_052854988.1 RNA-binding protein MEX3A [Drosophila gunungcola]XP_052854989.1 RNA-binding protein MEX3A [Drosophila gunungcola]